MCRDRVRERRHARDRRVTQLEQQAYEVALCREGRFDLSYHPEGGDGAEHLLLRLLGLRGRIVLERRHEREHEARVLDKGGRNLVARVSIFCKAA